MQKVQSALIHWYDNSSCEGLVKTQVNGATELVYFSALRGLEFESGQDIVINLYQDQTFIGVSLNEKMTKIATKFRKMNSISFNKLD